MEIFNRQGNDFHLAIEMFQSSYFNRRPQARYFDFYLIADQSDFIRQENDFHLTIENLNHHMLFVGPRPETLISI